MGGLRDEERCKFLYFAWTPEMLTQIHCSELYTWDARDVPVALYLCILILYVHNSRSVTEKLQETLKITMDK